MKIAKRATPERVKPTPLKARRALRLTVQYASRAQKVPRESQFAEWVRAAMRSDAEITVRLVGEREGRELNRTYRGRDYATNVLTFVLHDSAPYEGDLALCVPVVAREAREQGKALAAHYAHLTVHGVLHLQGYEHENDADAVAMERLEKRILKRLGYPDPYSAPSKNGRHTQ